MCLHLRWKKDLIQGTWKILGKKNRSLGLVGNDFRQGLVPLPVALPTLRYVRRRGETLTYWEGFVSSTYWAMAKYAVMCPHKQVSNLCLHIEYLWLVPQLWGGVEAIAEFYTSGQWAYVLISQRKLGLHIFFWQNRFTFHHCKKTPEINTQKDKVFHLPHVFRAVCLWLIDLAALSLILSQSIVMEEPGKRKLFSPMMPKRQEAAERGAGTSPNRHYSKATFLGTSVIKAR